MAQQPARRLEDRIRDLCTRVASVDNSDFLEIVAVLHISLNEFMQLQVAIKDLMRRTDNNAAATLFSWPEFPRERRGIRLGHSSPPQSTTVHEQN